MAVDNVSITAGAGTIVRTLGDASSNEWQAVVACYATTISPGANVLQVVTPTTPMPVGLSSAQLSTLTPPPAITGFTLETGHIATIDAKIPPMGQALAAASTPVVLTAAQLAALTPLTTVTANIGTAGTLALESGGHLASVDSKIAACNTGAVVLAAGTAVIGHAIIDSMPAINGTVGVSNFPTGFLSAQSGTWNVGLSSGTNVIGHVIIDSGSVTVGGTVAISNSTFGISAGSAIIGKVGIDQTTPGTTNAVSAAPIRGTLTNRSGTITAAGTSQVLAASNASRSYLFILNPASATESLWIDFTATAVAASPSIEIKPGQSFTFEGRFVSTEAINVIATTTAHAFTAKEG